MNMWRTLVQLYAMRAREFSDAVAALGHHLRFGPEACPDLLEEIRTRREACIAVGAEFDRHIIENANAVENAAENLAGTSWWAERMARAVQLWLPLREPTPPWDMPDYPQTWLGLIWWRRMVRWQMYEYQI